MEYRPRIYYTEAQKALMWDRWQTGEGIWRHTSTAEKALKAWINPLRTRGDIARCARRWFAAFDCSVIGSGSIDRQPRDKA